ncbi:MAG: AMP-dependent synthetase [Clostridiales bacterium]|nr:MAG: AMP-dependent synthetase [Clostridiales bacterium]
MIITDILTKNAQLYGNEVSLIEVNPEIQERIDRAWKEYDLVEALPKPIHRRELTWGEFERDANKLAHHFLSEGVTKGSKVAILLMNCIGWLPMYFGILKTGAVVCPMNFRYSAQEIKYCLELSESDVLIFGSAFISRINEIKDSLTGIKEFIFAGNREECPEYASFYEDVVKDMPGTNVHISISEDDDAAIYFSSGTTGFPKAVLHTHKSLLASCYTENNNHSQTKDDVFLCIPPLYHTGAKMHWFGSFLVGGKAVLLRGVQPNWILKTISEERVTICWLLVPWAQDILDAIDNGSVNLEDYDLSCWRLMHIGAQPVPPSLIKRWKKHFPNHQYDTNYGLTESLGPGCIHLGVENIHKVGAIGIPGKGWEAQIWDENHNPVEKGKVGELAVKGVSIMKCYYRDEEATKKCLFGDWLLTGDMAEMDEDGFIYLVDRKKDVIISGGENLYPVEIENYIRAYDKVKDVAVIGTPDKRLGEIATAIIEIKDGMTCTCEEIEKYCEGMARYKRPKQIIFDDIPRNPTGKIEKPKLRKKYCGEAVVAQQNEIKL